MSLHVFIFVEIFSGSGRLGAAAAAEGFFVLLWDITLGADYDLRVPAMRRRLLGWFSDGAADAAHAGIPCGSWSQARRGNPDLPSGVGWPPPLRSDEHPFGKPDLAPLDQAKVHDGNILMRFTLRLLSPAERLGFPMLVENPASSRLWKLPALRALAARRHVDFAVTAFCRWGENWQTRTGCLGVHLVLDPIKKTCKMNGNVCIARGRRHVCLTGAAPGGRLWTAIAEPYPRPLCRVLAQVLVSGLAARKAAAMKRFV